MDRYTIEYYQKNITNYKLEVKKAYNFPIDFGILTFGEYEKLEICAKDFVKYNINLFDKDLDEFLKVTFKYMETSIIKWILIK